MALANGVYAKNLDGGTLEIRLAANGLTFTGAAESGVVGVYPDAGAAFKALGGYASSGCRAGIGVVADGGTYAWIVVISD